MRDVAIIGAGPVGLFGVFACGMVGLSCHVFDALPHVGGQCAALYPEKPIYDIPGFPIVAGEELVVRLEKQAEAFEPNYHLGTQITAVSGSVEEGFTLTNAQGESFGARRILIAGGNGHFAPQRPPLKNLDQYEGVSVFYTVRDRKMFAGKRVVIAGGGDSAVDWALLLYEEGAKVSLVHRRDNFRAAPASVTRLRSLAETGAIDLLVPWQVQDITPHAEHMGKFAALTLSDGAGGTSTLEADIFIPCFGLAASLGPLATWGFGLEGNQIVINPQTGATSQAGIYAAGDIAAYPNKLKLILTGFAEATQAAHEIYRDLNPDKPLHFEHSTTKGSPSATQA